MNPITLRAGTRLSPRQVGYHLKRKLRNTFARRFPDAYSRYVARAAGNVPPLALASQKQLALEIAKCVSPFYFDEYRSAMDDAAAGRFTFFELEADFGSPKQVDWHHRVAAESDFHLWRMKLGHMGVVHPMLITGDDRHLAAVRDLLAGYRENSDFGVTECFSSYWFPYSVSHRILAVLSGYVLASETRDLPLDLCSDIESFLRWNVGFVLVNIEHELRNNHVERNLAALAFYLSCTSGVPARWARRLDREVRRIIDACVLPDGFIAERSAMYQGLTVMALEIFSRSPVLSASTRGVARRTHERALRAWATMTHPDGKIALFNDSWFGEVPDIRVVTNGQTVEPKGLLPDAGYTRLEADDVFVLMDAGPIGPRWNPGHGHADFLSVEVDLGGSRFLVDPGTYQYSTGPRRAYERSAESHNGPIKAGAEPVEYSGCFRVGRMSSAEITDYRTAASVSSVSGQLALPDGTTVSRSITVSPGSVRVGDEWTSHTPGTRVRLTVPDDWTLTFRGDDRLVFKRDDMVGELLIDRGTIKEVRTGEWSCNYLESRSATVVDLAADAADTGAALVWGVLMGGFRTPGHETHEEKDAQ